MPYAPIFEPQYAMNTVGIDFGTTKTLVAAVDGRSGKPEPIRLGRSGYEVPTTVHVDAKRQILFGEDADDLLASDGKNYLPRIKRDLGTAREHVLNGHRFAPVDLASEFLRHIRERVESEHFHGKIDHAVITVPAKFGPAARRDLETAAERAGFTSFELLDEPIAAGIAFLKEKGESELGNDVLVFDWGGGTLDIAMVEHRNGTWNLNHDLLEGDSQLGGEDINDSILDAVNRGVKAAGHVPIERMDQPNHSILSRKVVEMKLMLSRKESHTIKHKHLTANCDIEFPCTRSVLESFISEELDQAFRCLANWEQKARPAGKMPENVLLVGGTSQIPAVAKRLEQYGMKPIRWVDGMRAVALGAAVHAHKGRGEAQGIPFDGKSETPDGSIASRRDAPVLALDPASIASDATPRRAIDHHVLETTGKVGNAREETLRMRPEAQIYITRDDQQFGPYSIHEINAHLNSRELLDSDLAWYDGLPAWVPLSNVNGIILPNTPPLPPTGGGCPNPGGYRVYEDVPWYRRSIYTTCSCSQTS